MLTAPHRIFGIGSPHGMDRVGWLIAERISRNQNIYASIRAMANPLSMLDHLEGSEFLLIIDACVTGAEVGSVIRLSWPDRRLVTHRSLSSHGLSLGETLQLAQELGRLPKSVVMYGLEVGEIQLDPSGSDKPIPGLDELERRVVAEVIRWQVEQPDLQEQNNDA